MMQLNFIICFFLKETEQFGRFCPLDLLYNVTAKKELNFPKIHASDCYDSSRAEESVGK